MEGELRFRLSGENSVPASRRHTQALKEAILLVAESTKVNRQVLYDLLRGLKTISDNPADKSIRLFFFDGATARKFQHTPVPFGLQFGKQAWTIPMITMGSTARGK